MKNYRENEREFEIYSVRTAERERELQRESEVEHYRKQERGKERERVDRLLAPVAHSEANLHIHILITGASIPLSS